MSLHNTIRLHDPEYMDWLRLCVVWATVVWLIIGLLNIWDVPPRI